MSDDQSFDGEELLAQAEALELAGDYNAAVTRAQAAMRAARLPDIRDRIAFALERFGARERVWTNEAERRREASVSREVALA